MTTVIIGGGIAGLVAANQLARSGQPVVLLEKASALGGRAATREKRGYFFNLGPHALYRKGILRQTLQSYGIDPTGRIPGVDGGFAIYRGQRHTLPTGFASLVTTGLLSLPAKFEFAKLLSTIGAIDAAAVQHETLESWLDRSIRHERVRAFLRMLVRVSTFTHAPERQSAGAAIEQLQLAVAGNVLYVDGGWQTIVDSLRRCAVAAGVQIRTAAPAVSLDMRDARVASAVRLADRTVVPASAVIVTGAPADVDALTGTTFVATLPPPVRVATLDLALRSLTEPKRLVAFGVDEPLYFSVHSAVARLAPVGAALLHVSQYLRPDETAGRDVEQRLERLADDLQPGWREVIESKQFLPSLTVTHAQLTAAQGGLAGRPSSRVAAFDNVFVAGDWVGARGQLSDAAAASAIDAANAILSPAEAGHHSPAEAGHYVNRAS